MSLNKSLTIAGLAALCCILLGVLVNDWLNDRDASVAAQTATTITAKSIKEDNAAETRINEKAKQLDAMPDDAILERLLDSAGYNGSTDTSKQKEPLTEFTEVDTTNSPDLGSCPATNCPKR